MYNRYITFFWLCQHVINYYNTLQNNDNILDKSVVHFIITSTPPYRTFYNYVLGTFQIVFLIF